jgi:hypothetical protein
MMKFQGFVGLLLSLLFRIACLFRSGSETYSTGIGALRARFNEDGGKVRLLLILSPT